MGIDIYPLRAKDLKAGGSVRRGDLLTLPVTLEEKYTQK